VRELKPDKIHPTAGLGIDEVLSKFEGRKVRITVEVVE